MRGSRPRKPTSNAFLDAAKKQAEDAQEKERAATTTDAAREAYRQRQADFIDRNVFPVLDALTALPARDGRAFSAEIRYAFDKTSVDLAYTGGRSGIRGGLRSRVPLQDKVAVVLDWYKADNDFSARVIRYDQHAPETMGKHLTVTVKSVEGLQAELGKWVANVAPERLSELEAPKASGKKPGPRR